MSASPYRFNLNPTLSPTFYNLYHHLLEQGWSWIRIKYLAHFGEKNFQFHAPAAEQLEFKHLLAQLVKQYCPEVMPETHEINDKNWPLILENLTRKRDDSIWILKPSLLNNGQHIKLFSHLFELEQHYLSSKRLGGEHVLQRYISSPHLLKNHKYSIRMFVVMTNYSGSYLYPQGYLNVSLQAYHPTELNHLASHLTNEHLDEDQRNVIQIPSDRLDLFVGFYSQIKIIVKKIAHALQHRYPQAFKCKKERALAIFGFDFIVDAQLKVWLLEVNHGPCFPTSDTHPLQGYFYYHFWQALVKSFVSPIAMQQKIEEIDYQAFETL